MLTFLPGLQMGQIKMAYIRYWHFWFIVNVHRSCCFFSEVFFWFFFCTFRCFLVYTNVELSQSKKKITKSGHISATPSRSLRKRHAANAGKVVRFFLLECLLQAHPVIEKKIIFGKVLHFYGQCSLSNFSGFIRFVLYILRSVTAKNYF